MNIAVIQLSRQHGSMQAVVASCKEVIYYTGYTFCHGISCCSAYGKC